jgi:hypothetical protein
MRIGKLLGLAAIASALTFGCAEKPGVKKEDDKKDGKDAKKDGKDAKKDDKAEAKVDAPK